MRKRGSGDPGKAWRAMGLTGMAAPLAIEPAAWELLLARVALPEEQALPAIRARSELGRKLALFARDCCRDHYVPEAVLEELGLGPQAERATMGSEDATRLRKAQLRKMRGEGE